MLPLAQVLTRSSGSHVRLGAAGAEAEGEEIASKRAGSAIVGLEGEGTGSNGDGGDGDGEEDEEDTGDLLALRNGRGCKVSSIKHPRPVTL
jgi:hypothetical protein